MLIINKPRLPPIHLNRPTAAFEPDSAAPRLVLRLQWACFGGLVGRLGLLMINLLDKKNMSLLMHMDTKSTFAGHIRGNGCERFVNWHRNHCLCRALLHLWQHHGQTPAPWILLWHTSPEKPHTGWRSFIKYSIWMGMRSLLLAEFSCLCCQFKSISLQLLLMFPIVIRAGKGFFGSEEWGTRFVEETTLRKQRL